MNTLKKKKMTFEDAILFQKKAECGGDIDLYKFKDYTKALVRECNKLHKL